MRTFFALTLAGVLACACVAAEGGAPANAACAPRPQEDAGPRWSPDARTIAFFRLAAGCSPRAAAIYFVRPDGSRLRRVAAAARANESAPEWSRDGGRLAFRSPRGIAVLDVASRRIMLVTHDPSDRKPVWAPDGTALAYVRGDRGAWVVPIGGTPRHIARIARGTAPTWGSTSRSLAVVVPHGATLDIAAFDTQTGSSTFVTRSALREREIAWSPDGAWIAYTTDRPDIDAGVEVRRVRADGSRVDVIVNSFMVSPAWDSSGRLLATLWTEPNYYGVGWCRLDGHCQQATTRGNVVGPATFSPGARRLVYASRGPCGRAGIYVYTRFGDERRITNLCPRR